MSDTTYYCKQNDTARSLSWTLAVGSTVVDLTNATASLFIRHGDTTVSRSVTYVTRASGSISYDLIAADTADVGSHFMEFKVVYNDGTILYLPTQDRICMEVLDNLS